MFDSGRRGVQGMIIAEHVRPAYGRERDEGKKLTNMRTTASDEMIILEPPSDHLGAALEYIEDDELIEVTPSSLRREASLGASEPAQAARSEKRALSESKAQGTVPEFGLRRKPQPEGGMLAASRRRMVAQARERRCSTGSSENSKRTRNSTEDFYDELDERSRRRRYDEDDYDDLDDEFDEGKRRLPAQKGRKENGIGTRDWC